MADWISKTVAMRFTLSLLLLVPIISFSQSKKEEPIYVKLAGSFYPKDQGVTFGGHFSVGGRFGRYATLGGTAGYLKPKGFGKGIIPIGIDLNFTDFGKKGIFPVLIAGAYYPIYKERINSPVGVFDASGKLQYQIGGGLSISASERQKVLLTVAFSQLKIDNKIAVATGTTGKTTQTTNMAVFSLSFIL